MEREDRAIEGDDESGGAFEEHLSRLAWQGRVDLPEPGMSGRVSMLFRRAIDLRPAAGDRARRPAVDAVAGDPPVARSNWLPMGPRNVAGRVKALAVSPADPNVWYAGSAGGGMYRSTNRGVNWERVWDVQPTFSVAAIAVAAEPGPTPDPANDRVVVATGEIRETPSGGLWVSSHGGIRGSWAVGSPPASSGLFEGGLDAAAIDPTDRDHAWVVGVNGAFRTLNGGTDWVHIDAGVYWSDVHFTPDGRLFLARGGRFDDDGTITARGLLCRLTTPRTAGTADLVDPANVSVVVDRPLGARSWPARVKFAIAPSNPNTVYATVVDDRELGRVIGVFRTTRADRAADDFRWARLADSTDFHDENQGLYDLAMAVHPTQVGTLALGLTDIYVSTNAGGAANSVTWRKAMSWQLHDAVRAQHADCHAMVAIGGELWVGNDGGISLCDNWTTATTAMPTRLPLDATTYRWVGRDDGISGSMFYDINQSPLVPGVVAGGFQDNGVHMTASSHTWHNIHGGDGGFAAFDPDDPFTMVVTTQDGIDRLRFPGHRDLQFPDEQPPGPLPVSRRLDDGFRSYDPPLFVADTVRHRRDRARVLHGRVGRLYGQRSATGERWEVEPVGRSFELRIALPAVANRLTVTVEDTPAAHRLGLVPGTVRARRHDDPMVDPPPGPLTAAFVSHLPAPYDLRAGDLVRLRIDDGATVAPYTVTFTAGSAVDLPATTMAEAVAAFNGAAVPGLEALPRFWPTPHSVELITTTVGPGASITLDGTALASADPSLRGLAWLGINPGTYRGHDAMPASVTIGQLPRTRPDQLLNRRLPAGSQTLRVAVDGRPPVTVDLATAVPDPAWVTAPELASVLAAALAGERIRVVATSRVKRVVLEADDGHTVVVSGTAAERLNLPTFPRVTTVVDVDPYWADNAGRHIRNHNSVDLTPPDPATPLELVIGDGVNRATVTFDGAGIGHLRCVTAEELYRLIRTALSAATPAVAASVSFSSLVSRGSPSELASSPAEPDHLWVGSTDGLVFRSTDNGATWATLGQGVLDRAEAELEAIALHPTDSRIAYVGTRAPIDVPVHHSQVHRTGDGGLTWEPRGIEIDGHEVAIRALELHPDDPATVFAATDHGVFRSPDQGRSWTPFNHGLPAVSVVDLAVDPSGPWLIAATWGGGAYRRAIGAAPPDDVRLHLRATDLDVDGVRPAPAEPDPFAVTTASTRPGSPDIRITRGDVVAVTDGVIVDLDTFDEIPVDDQDATVVVQIHNRGSQPTRFGAGPNDPKARLVVLRTNVGRSVPDLPVDFWTRFRSGVLTGVLGGSWHVVHDGPLPGPVGPDGPAIVQLTITGPDRAALALSGPRIGLLALVCHPDDELTGGHTGIDKLLDSERRAAYRETEVLRRFEDNRLVLRSTTAELVEVIDDPAPRNSPAAANLRLPAPSAAASIVASAPGAADTAYDLGAVSADARSVLIAQRAGQVDLEFTNDFGEFATITAARPSEIAAFISRRLARAGLPLLCARNEDHLRIRAEGGATVQVTGGTSTGGPLLAFTPAAPSPMVTSPSRDNLPVGGTIDLRIQTPGRVDNVTVVLDHNLPWEQAAVLNRQFAELGLDSLLRAESPVGIFLYALGRGDLAVTFTLSGPDLALFDLRPGTDTFVQAAFGPRDLSAGPRFTITSSHEIRVRFRRDPAMTPAEVRRTINEAMLVGGFAARAEPALTRLRVGASTSDRGPAPARTGGAALADIATSGAVAAPAPADLFDLRTALGPDDLAAGAANHLYVRAANDGNVSTSGGRFRLYRIDIGLPLVTPHLSDDVDLEVGAGSIAIGHLSHTPVAAVGGVELMLAVVDQNQPGRVVDPPVTWPDLDALRAWVADRPSVSLRRFDVT